ncbi:hypothetical protein PACILC2_26870 [Paenibacillus cisolokensis]|uniref:Inner membrane protein n=1 Tax=Paenibacillus cisolokensis TaxID=1658519 RepID=A0ABQ4N7A9_9BACL|nr:hypothetical protein PACILC2_26870 [Paenibacillus cisolokensis]
MARMFRVLGFWTLVIGLMAFAGHMIEMAILFFVQTAVFVLLGYLNFSERTYLTIFGLIWSCRFWALRTGPFSRWGFPSRSGGENRYDVYLDPSAIGFCALDGRNIRKPKQPGRPGCFVVEPL